MKKKYQLLEMQSSSLIQPFMLTEHHCKHASWSGSFKSWAWSVCPKVTVPLDLKSFC